MLSKQPRRIEDELLLQVGDEKLRQDIEDSLRMVQRLERSMDAEHRDLVRSVRMPVIERLERFPVGPESVSVCEASTSLLDCVTLLSTITYHRTRNLSLIEY